MLRCARSGPRPAAARGAPRTPPCRGRCERAGALRRYARGASDGVAGGCGAQACAAGGAIRGPVVDTSREYDACPPGRRPDPAPVKRIAASLRLVRDDFHIGVEGGTRRALRAESLELRMMTVAPGLAAEHRAGEKTLAPQRHEPLGIEILRVQRPKARRPPNGRGAARPLQQGCGARRGSN
jgi:hypothetical protein